MSTALVLTVLTAGRIAGTVAYAGPPPRAARLARNDAACARELIDPSVQVKGGVANVLVRVVKGAEPVEPPPEPVVVSHRGCMYEPRVQGAVRGQAVVVKNEDAATHNAHAYVGFEDRRTLFNVTQPQGAKAVERAAGGTLGVVQLACELHPWQRAFIVFSEHRLFAVSDAEGRFALEAPPGDYTVEAWHEKLGLKRVEVKVEDGETVDPGFSFR